MSGPLVLGVLAAKLTGRPVKLVATRAAALRPVRPPLADAPAAAARRRRRRAADGARPSRQGRNFSVRRFLRARRRRLADALRQRRRSRTSHEAVRLDTGTPMFVRAPGEATGSIALESAIDEMAAALRHGPAASSACSTTPRSSRSPASRSPRRRCANVSRKARRRSAGPAGRCSRARCATSDGLLVGWGVGVATFPAVMFQGDARAPC